MLLNRDRPEILQPPQDLCRPGARSREPVSGFEPLTARLQGQSREALSGPAKTEVADERNRARRKVRMYASRPDTACLSGVTPRVG